MEAILGRKLGMTQVFAANGEAHGVTVVEAGPCVVVQIKTKERDGYDAVQLGFGARKRVNDPQRGHMKRLGEFRYLREVRVDDANAYEVGQKLGAELFAEGDVVDVVGTSKGRGFAGGVKRYHFRGGPKTHGQSDRHRAPGSIGSGTTPGRVRKGLHMAGHMGDARVTVKNLKVFESNPARGVLLIEGAVPGATGGLLQIARSAKMPVRAVARRASEPRAAAAAPAPAGASEDPRAEGVADVAAAVSPPADEPAALNEVQSGNEPVAENESEE